MIASRVIASAGGISVLNRFTEARMWDMDTKHCSDALADEMLAADEWCERLHRPSPPLLRESWACCQDLPKASTKVHSAKRMMNVTFAVHQP